MALERDFERFDSGPNVPQSERLHVTLRPKGDIFLNETVYRSLGRPQAVALYYSRERWTIAIEPAYARQPRNFPVIKAQTGWRIRSSPFCRHYGIRLAGTERFAEPEITESGHLLLNLRRTIKVPTRKRKKRPVIN